MFVFLSQIFVLEPHFNKAKSSSPLRLTVSHDNSINDNTKLFKVVNKVALLGLIG